MSQRMHNLEGGKALINKALHFCFTSIKTAVCLVNPRSSLPEGILKVGDIHPYRWTRGWINESKRFGKDWIQEGLLVQWMPPSGGLLSCPGCPRGTSQPRKVWRSPLEFFEQSLNMCTLIPFEKLQSAAVLELPDCLFLTPPTALDKQNDNIFQRNSMERITCSVQQYGSTPPFPGEIFCFSLLSYFRHVLWEANYIAQQKPQHQCYWGLHIVSEKFRF